jgi:hypothetical protein
LLANATDRNSRAHVFATNSSRSHINFENNLNWQV